MNQMEESALVISLMVKEDIPELLVIEALCFDKGWSSHTLHALLKDENSSYFSVRWENKLVGYGGMQMILDEANLDNMAVHPTYQSRGIGRKLLEKILKVAAIEKAGVIMLEVRKSNEKAIRLYESMGFYKVGERKNYYTHPTEDALLMNGEINKEDADENV